VGLVGLLTVAGAQAHAQDDTKVRSSSPALAALIRGGVADSPTFRRLVDAVDASDGLVYIEPGRCGVNGARACLAHRIIVAGPSRILHILVDPRTPDRNLSSAIAHELQHALEVLSDSTITNDLAVTRFYLHRGIRVNGVLETQEALDIGNAVRDELGRRPQALAIVLAVENDARIPSADLAEVEALVARSYLAIGVRVIWVHGEVAQHDSRGLRIHLRLLSRTRANRMITTEIGSTVLALANRPSQIVYVFCHRVVEASFKYSLHYTRILGLVVAHELGHVLLPANSHSEAGVMKGRANLWAKPAFDFTPEEGAAIRSMLRQEVQARD
jgi:hypothetical protein